MNRPLTAPEVKKMFEAMDEARTMRETQDELPLRDGHQIRSATDAIRFLLAGKAIFTIRSLKTGTRFTYKIRQAPKRDAQELPVHFVSVLTGFDNVDDYTFIGTIFEGSTFRWSHKSRIGEGGPSVVAFRWTLDHLLADALPCTLEIWHEGRCGRCGRRLTVPESIETGMGPECAGRL